MKMTRRKLAAAVMGSAAGALAQAQAPATVSAEDELKAARDRQRARSESLAAHEVPMSVEPAFHFQV